MTMESTDRRTPMLALYQVAMIPSNLRRGYGLRTQWALYRIARKVERHGE